MMSRRFDDVDRFGADRVIAQGAVERLNADHAVGTSFAVLGLGSLAASCDHNL